MEIRGERRIAAPRSRVWAALLDPDALRDAIPGCESLVESGPDSYDVTATVGVAIFRGTVSGRITIEQSNPEHALRVVASGDGDGDALAGGLTVELEDLARGDEGTRLSYVAELGAAGAPGGAAARVLERIAKSMAARFFDAIAERVEATN